MPITSTASGIKAGIVTKFAASTAPAGWLKANGALVSRATYAALFAAIGTTYGAGDGATTFAVPDLRGEFVRGLDDGRGIDIGRAIGTVQSDDFKSHTHHMGLASSQAAFTAQNNALLGIGTAPSSATGGNETRPRNVAMLACIKY